MIQSLSMILFLDLEKKQCPSPAFCNKLDSHSSPITSSNSFYYYFTIYNLGAEVGRKIGSPVQIPSDGSAPPPPSATYNDETRVKHTVVGIEDVDYIAMNKYVFWLFEVVFYMQGGILFFNGQLIFHILDVENEHRKTSVPSYVE